MVTWEEVKDCMHRQGRLDLEAWDVMFFEPLKDLFHWFERMDNLMKAFMSTFAAKAASFLADKVLKEQKEQMVKAFGEFVRKVIQSRLPNGPWTTFVALLLAVLAGLAFGTFMDMLGRCLGEFV